MNKKKETIIKNIYIVYGNQGSKRMKGLKAKWEITDVICSARSNHLRVHRGLVRHLAYFRGTGCEWNFFMHSYSKNFLKQRTKIVVFPKKFAGDGKLEKTKYPKMRNPNEPQLRGPASRSLTWRDLQIPSVCEDNSAWLPNTSKKRDLQISLGLINPSKLKIDFRYLTAFRDHRTKASK